MTKEKLEKLNRLHSQYKRAMEKCQLLERLRENPKPITTCYLACGLIEPDAELNQAMYALARDHYERKARTLKQEFENA